MAYEIEKDGNKLIAEIKQIESRALDAGLESCSFTEIIPDIERVIKDGVEHGGSYETFETKTVDKLFKQYFAHRQGAKSVIGKLTNLTSHEKELQTAIMDTTEQTTFAELYNKYPDAQEYMDKIKGTPFVDADPQLLYRKIVVEKNDIALKNKMEELGNKQDGATTAEHIDELILFKGELPKIILKRSPCVINGPEDPMAVDKKGMGEYRRMTGNSGFDEALMFVYGTFLLAGIFGEGKSHHARVMAHITLETRGKSVFILINENSADNIKTELARLDTNIPWAVYTDNLLYKYSAKGVESKNHTTEQIEGFLDAEVSYRTKAYENKADLLRDWEQHRDYIGLSKKLQELQLAGAQNLPMIYVDSFSTDNGDNDLPYMLEAMDGYIEDYDCDTFVIDQISNFAAVKDTNPDSVSGAYAMSNLIEGLVLRCNDFALAHKLAIIANIQLTEQGTVALSKGALRSPDCGLNLEAGETPGTQLLTINKVRKGGTKGITLQVEKDVSIPLTDYASGTLDNLEGTSISDKPGPTVDSDDIPNPGNW